MSDQTMMQQRTSWTTRRDEKRRLLESVKPWMKGPVLAQNKMVEVLETVIQSSDRIVIEGDNQKQADFLSRSLAKVDPKKIHDLHLIISSISRPEHLTLFELGIAKKVDFAFAGPQSLRVAQLLEDGPIRARALRADLRFEVAPEILRDAVVIEQRIVHVEQKNDFRRDRVFGGRTAHRLLE